MQIKTLSNGVSSCQVLKAKRQALAAKKATTAESDTTPGRDLKSMRLQHTPTQTPKKAPCLCNEPPLYSTQSCYLNLQALFKSPAGHCPAEGPAVPDLGGSGSGTDLDEVLKLREENERLRAIVDQLNKELKNTNDGILRSQTEEDSLEGIVEEEEVLTNEALRKRLWRMCRKQANGQLT